MGAKLKQFLWGWRTVWVTVPSVTGLVILLRLGGLLQSWEWLVFDQYKRLHPPELRDNRIAIVGINEADVQKLGQSIIPDGVYAQLLQKLKAMQPRAIGLDIYRDLPVEPGHQELAQVFASTPNLVGIQKVIGDSRREAVAPPPILKAKGQVGANDLILDTDNVIRRGLISFRTQSDETIYSFSAYLALLYLNAQGIQPQIAPGSDNWLQIGSTTFPPFHHNDGAYVRADDRGYQVLLNYRGPSQHFETVSLMDVLENRVSSTWGRDRIILIGFVGESFQDVFTVPYTNSPSQRMAGIELHANLASQILSAALDDRPLIKTWADPWEWFWIFLWSAVGAMLMWGWRQDSNHKDLLVQRGVGFSLAVSGLVGSTYTAFLWGWWIPVVPPMLALGGSAIAITAYIARSASRIRKTFGRYLTDQVVANLLENPEGLKLGGERRLITILTSDLRGFTAQSEQLPPEEVIKVLNLYLEAMADVITYYQGTIDEFMGDGILVLFGAPTSRPDDAERSVACAIAMQLAMKGVNEKMQQLNLPNLEMGIGINTGEVVVGNIGSEKRAKYGVVGSQVNLTYRIESYTLGGQILISESTLTAAGSAVNITGQKQVQPKGVKQPITIYEVGGLGGEYNLWLDQVTEVFLELLEPLPLQYAVLDGKHVSEDLLKGSIIKLSAKGAEIHTEDLVEGTLPAALSNIKLNLLTFNAPIAVSQDIYAKVLEKPAGNSSFYIYFTAKPADVEAKLSALYKSLQV
ncbi:MAG: adenylate/guanylate cyclase domain-containing protein [Leptolyngbyaceae bacterium]|nr:adenylate/guanylate cyclase domain-containing protein [Leptolyngbyaceae bacterium]